ncbi:MAG: metal-dependent transcriptional regulator [Dehalococcoidia bacterium]|nr:metal-dependent transcriptional regulator [Dehalococcoidia bacterium]
MKTPESTEDYLETILMLSHSGTPTRSIDIVNEMVYSKPSVSIAMKKLRANGHIDVDANGYITLTDSGREIAQKIYERHKLFSDWLVFLGVDRETAVNDACKIEHGMSDKSFFAIQKHFEYWKRSLYKQSSKKGS